MKRVSYTVLTCLFFAQLCCAQNTIGYFFENTFKPNDPAYPSLVILGRQGIFIQDPLPELGGMKKTAYQFERNSGVQFDNAEANNFITDSYTIEIYFRFDKLNSWKRVVDFKNRKTDWGCYIFNGKLNFYNLLISEKAPVNENEYTHYTIARDGTSNIVKIFADGVLKLEFVDTEKHATIDADNKLNFFFDDLKVTDEASAGAVVMIKISNYLISPENIKNDFDSLKANVSNFVPGPVTTTPTVIVTNTPSENLNAKITIGVKDNENKKPIEDFAYTIKNGAELIAKGNSNHKGSSSLSLIKNKAYSITIKAKGYVTIEDSIKSGNGEQELVLSYSLNPIKVGQTVTLKTLQFERGKDELLPASYAELDKLAEFMKENPTMEIELSGHTDNQGSVLLNVQLSENRVKATKDYLVSKGIDKNRIKGKGYGGSKPIASNSKEETRMLNRRVEMTIIKN